VKTANLIPIIKLTKREKKQTKGNKVVKDFGKQDFDESGVELEEEEEEEEEEAYKGQAKHI
jgi:hypothetical protein